MEINVKEEYSVDEIVNKVSKEFGGILRTNLYETVLKDEELKKLRRKKALLREALKNSGIGDLHAKNYVKEAIRSILEDKLKINEDNIDNIINFANPYKMSARDKFDIILHLYKKVYGYDGLSQIIKEYDIHGATANGSGGFDDNMVNTIFEDCYDTLEFNDKLEVVVQRIYAQYRGLGIIDEIRDMRIDGVLGGVSGKSGSFNSVWIVYKGVMIHFSFLDFLHEYELKRICMNIYRYDNPQQLSRSKGYVVNQMKDHSRVVVVRPPFAESYGFFVRKFNSIEKKNIGELIDDEGCSYPIEIIKWLVKGCQVTAITGMQGSGKTTLLMSMIEFIHPSYTIRVQEMAFELHLRDVYEDRNIMTFRETDEISGQEGLDLQKKTDGNVNILGEVASSPVAAWMIQMTQSGGLFTMFTHHARTTESLIKYLRNSLLSGNIFKNEKIATEQVTSAVRFDIHLDKSIDGHRYIERITEIIQDSDNTGEYLLKDIVVFENNRYVLKNIFSKEVSNLIYKQLENRDKEKFYEDMALWETEINKNI